MFLKGFDLLLFGRAQHIGLSVIFCLGVGTGGSRLQNMKGTQHWCYGNIGGQDFVLDFCRSRNLDMCSLYFH